MEKDKTQKETLLRLSEPLDISQIDFRVQSINKGGYATIIAYKDARVDQQRLDDSVGAMNWKRQHLNNNINCIVSIWCSEKKEWIGKEDAGAHLNPEKPCEKSLASDSFKRACFNWGIGRELYNYPEIRVKLLKDEYEMKSNGTVRATWKLKVKEWKWASQFKNGEITFLYAKDESDNVRFKWGSYVKEEKEVQNGRK